LKEETLQKVAEILGNGYKCYVNKSTEEVLTAEKVSLEDQQRDNYREYLPLEGPLTFGFMQDFVNGIEDFEKQSELLESISFEQPFKNFKTKIYNIGMADEWIAYRIQRIVELIK